jgi:phenylalanyl-tRNA synthetase beta chain
MEIEERIRDILTGLGLQEVINYRMTSVEREARLQPVSAGAAPDGYLRLKNPITPERSVLRRSLLASVMDTLEKNSRLEERLAIFEIGPVFYPQPDHELPAEPIRLAVALRGPRELPGWDRPQEKSPLDFYDLKGILESLLGALHLPDVSFTPAEDPRFHPGRSAQVRSQEAVLGVFGELHSLIKGHYDVGEAPVLAGDFDLEQVIARVPDLWTLEPVPVFPPVLEDIAVVVEEGLPAAQVETAIRQAGGAMLTGVRLFDIFRGEQIGAGKKSLAYSLTYQAPDRTLTDAEAAQIRQRVVRRLEQDLGARLRS